MKDFMLLFLGADYGDIGLSPEEVQQRMEKWFAWHSKMEGAGILKGGEALAPNLVRITGPDRTVTDRTATELKELVGGYFIVSVEDVEAAKQVAQDFPDYDLGGTVEIREVMVFDQ
ncbi:MAG: YciI family protein [Bacteroidota bacterium]